VAIVEDFFSKILSHVPPIKWVSEDLSLGIKRPGREAEHSPPPSAEMKE